MMDTIIIVQMILASVGGAVLYTAIGVAPGPDETGVLEPVTIALALVGLSPYVILAFFISAIVAKKLTDSIPVAVGRIHCGGMTASIVDYALGLRENSMP